MNKHEQLINYIKGIVNLTPEETNWIKESFSPKIIKKKQHFIKAGEKVNYIGFINNGIFRYYYLDFEGNEKIKCFETSNDVILSFNSFIERTPSRVFIQALQDSEIMIMSIDTAYEFLKTNANWQQLYTKILEKTYLIKEKREAELLMLNATDRYLNFIKEYPDISKTIKQHYIASYLGITPESLSRIRAQFGIS